MTRAELKRASESMEKYKKSVSATELDRLRLEAERAALQVEQARQELKIAGFTLRLKQNEVDYAAWTLDRLRIKSPLDGMVVEANQRPGEWVEPGETMFRIVRIDRLRVEAFVDARHASNSLVGRDVKLTVDSAGPAPRSSSAKWSSSAPKSIRSTARRHLGRGRESRWRAATRAARQTLDRAATGRCAAPGVRELAAALPAARERKPR